MNEYSAIAAAGRPAARAAARMMALRARTLLNDAERILSAADEDQPVLAAFRAGEAATELISATYDGGAKVFACKR